jgi:hypothetical protein
VIDPAPPEEPTVTHAARPATRPIALGLTWVMEDGLRIRRLAGADGDEPEGADRVTAIAAAIADEETAPTREQLAEFEDELVAAFQAARGPGRARRDAAHP